MQAVEMEFRANFRMDSVSMPRYQASTVTEAR